jgi:hypothetical protein
MAALCFNRQNNLSLSAQLPYSRVVFFFFFFPYFFLFIYSTSPQFRLVSLSLSLAFLPPARSPSSHPSACVNIYNTILYGTYACDVYTLLCTVRYIYIHLPARCVLLESDCWVSVDRDTQHVFSSYSELLLLARSAEWDERKKGEKISVF